MGVPKLHSQMGQSVKICRKLRYIPSGKQTELWKDPPFLMVKSTINGHFQ